ncbi:hypothetical protein FZEAL_7527 [Fusarium zealandicum]|uniref:Uncharacterized protein n=1 Tax=Fusarium zealandicum TaxID=1053134 RepID=A0A8H4XHS2_9HYPO|nr:hypothetical protein FZEAL_7527 [Fusarium zealandicum]
MFRIRVKVTITIAAASPKSSVTQPLITLNTPPVEPHPLTTAETDRGMARKGGKSTQRGKPKRQLTEFGQLDTTPTSRHLESPQTGPSQPSAPAPRVAEDETQPLPQASVNPSRVQSSLSIDEYDDWLEDGDLINLANTEEDNQRPATENDLNWSEAGSLTRRSSPVEGRETPRDLWEFENQESLIDPFSSPRSGQGKLPDTMPLPSQLLIDPLAEPLNEAVAMVDFSETASTGRRSSPYASLAATSQVAAEEKWEPKENNPRELLLSQVLDPETLPETATFRPQSPVNHLPADELYDVTPPRSSDQHPPPPRPMQYQAIDDLLGGHQDIAPPQTSQNDQSQEAAPKAPGRSLINFLAEELASQPDEPRPASRRSKQEALTRKADVKKHPEEQLAASEIQESPAAELGPKGRKRKQRAKTPLQFDDATQEIKDIPRPKKTSAPVRMPIMNALKNSNASSSSPVTSAKKKAAPKATRKAAPKVASKTVSKPTTNKEPPQKKPKAAVAEEKTIAEEEEEEAVGQQEEKRDLLIIHDTTAVADLPPASNTRAKTAREPHVEPAKDQQNLEAKNESQGSPQDPVVVSSDPDNSSMWSEDESVPPEPPRSPAVTQTATQKPTVDTDACSAANSTVALQHEPQQHLEAAHNPQSHQSPRSLRSSRAQKAKLSSVIEPRKQLSALSRNTKPMSLLTKIVKPKVLSPRDPNINAKRAPRPLGKTIVSQKQAPARLVETIPAQPARKASKAIRSFSISRVGSPVPVEAGHAPLVAESSSQNAGSQDPQENDLQQGYLSGLSLAKSTRDMTRISLRAESQKQTRKQETVPPPELAVMNKDLHAQILASLRGQTETSVEAQNVAKQNKTRHQGNEVVEQDQSEDPADEAAHKLHALVETILSHLRTKEVTVFRGADAYRKSGIHCVDKIEQKYGQERRALADACKKDGDKFARRVREARGALEDHEKVREEAIQRLEETAAKRQQLYQQATANLRGLHGRLLKRKVAEDREV